MPSTCVRNSTKTVPVAPVVPQLSPEPRLLAGPGPGSADPRVLAAMSLPEIGHLDPQFLRIMEEIKTMMRYTWQTNNEFTIPVSGTGSAAMEACMCNLLEEGDKILIGSNGYFGPRLADMASRYGAVVVTMNRPWGTVFTLEEVTAAVKEHKPKVLALVHAETSTGACQPFEGIGDLCREHDILLVADCVTSISGMPCLLDEWKIDAAYAGTQKCLSCPPGVSPLSFNDRAMKAMFARKSKVKNWYLDMTMVASYLVAKSGGGARSYHHTAPINMVYGIREALKIVCEEGLEARWARHYEIAQYFWKKLDEMGLECFVAEKDRLWSLTTVKVPEGVSDKQITAYILKNFHIEIGAGLGDLAGKVFRIGTMGYNARKDVVHSVCTALEEALTAHGCTREMRLRGKVAKL